MSTIALSCPRRASSASPIPAIGMTYRVRIVLEVNRFIPCERSVGADRLSYVKHCRRVLCLLFTDSAHCAASDIRSYTEKEIESAYVLVDKRDQD